MPDLRPEPSLPLTETPLSPITSALPSVLVAGCGYLGEALAERFYSQGHAVTGLSRTVSSLHRFPVLSCDLSQAVSVRRLESLRPAIVVHCASSGRGGVESYRAVFLEGSRNLLETFPEARFFFTSSTSVYGQVDGAVVTEESPAEPDRETGQILREAENLVLGGGGTVLRLAGIYGPGRSVHLQRFLEGTATIEAGQVSRYLNQIHRDDAAAAIAHLAGLPSGETKGQIYNVADDTPLTQRACYEQLAEFFGKPLPPEAPPNLNRKRAWTHKSVSNEKLRAAGWAPRFKSFPDALRADPRLIPSIEALLES